jgi:hypothetical protein
MKIRTGQTFYSQVDSTAVVVVREPREDVWLTCGGVEMVATKPSERTAAADPTQLGGTQIGKRYTVADIGIELLCSKAGEGSLAVNGQPLKLKDAKPLPASD